MFNILVVEDDAKLRQLICIVLNRNGYKGVGVSDGEQALNALDEQCFDLIVTDIMMPNLDGYELIHSIRDSKMDIPILIITAKESLDDKKQGFAVGTDDYMVKPIDLDEMLLRIGALLRRARIATEHKLTIGDFTLNYENFTASDSTSEQELPQKEFLLIFKLLSYPDKIFTRLQLMDEIWGMDTNTDERTVDVHINRLRDRFRNCTQFEIVTVRGIGYKAVRKV